MSRKTGVSTVTKGAAPEPLLFADPNLAAEAAAAKASLAADEYVTSIKAVVRVRPLKSGDSALCIEPVPSDGPEALLRIVPNPSIRSQRVRQDDATLRNYDDIFWSMSPPPQGIPRCAGNSDIFNRVGVPVLDKAMRGMNSTVFAYGQTASGKSYTMGIGDAFGDEDKGLIPAIVRDLFARINAEASGGGDDATTLGAGLRREREVRCSFMEVFNDHINGGTVRDLNPYDLFTQDEAKRLRVAYAKAVTRDGGGGLHMDGVVAVLRTVLTKADDDELRTRAAMIYDYRGLDRRLTPQQLQRSLPEDGHGGFIRGPHVKEAGILATKRDDLVEDAGHYYPKGLSERRCRSLTDVEALLASGTARRRMCATDFNEHSSRSHAIVQLRLDTYLVSDEGKERIKDMTALINLVDLAGSERFDKAGTLASGRAGETQGINTSLDYLGRVLKGMAKGGRRGDVVGALRMVCLTRLLASSIGGNSETWMVACVNPSITEWEETSSTLAYAQVAREIKQVVRQNKTGLSDATLVIARLMAQLENMQGEESERVASMREELGRLERMRDQMEGDRAREREMLVRERARRAELEELREEQKRAFEGRLTSLELVAAEKEATLKELCVELDAQHVAREAAEAALAQLQDRQRAAAESRRAEQARRMDDVLRACADGREGERALAASLREDELARLDWQQQLEDANMRLELQRRSEALLVEQMAALRAGDEERGHQLEELRRRVRDAAAETDRARQRQQMVDAEFDAVSEKLMLARRRREELRQLTLALDDDIMAHEAECMDIERRIIAREGDIRAREFDLMERNRRLTEREDELKLRCRILDEAEQRYDDAIYEDAMLEEDAKEIRGHLQLLEDIVVQMEENMKS